MLTGLESNLASLLGRKSWRRITEEMEVQRPKRRDKTSKMTWQPVEGGSKRISRVLWRLRVDLPARYLE
jgi:hypothetical protein